MEKRKQEKTRQKVVTGMIAVDWSISCFLWESTSTQLHSIPYSTYLLQYGYLKPSNHNWQVLNPPFKKKHAVFCFSFSMENGFPNSSLIHWLIIMICTAQITAFKLWSVTTTQYIWHFLKQFPIGTMNPIRSDDWFEAKQFWTVDGWNRANQLIGSLGQSLFKYYS